MLVAVFPEFLRNGFGAITTVAFNHTQIAILIFSDNRKLSLAHDVLSSWFDSFLIRPRSARKPRSGQIPIDIPSVPSTVVEFKLTHYRRTYRGDATLTCSKRTCIRDATILSSGTLACLPCFLARPPPRPIESNEWITR